MTKKINSIEMLEKLTDALVEDIIELSDQEILLEAEEHFDDLSEENNHIRDVINSAVLRASKIKLTEAKKQVNEYKKMATKSNVISLSSAQKKSVIENFTTKDPELNQKLTLAARKGEGIQTENDIEGMFEDMLELGLIDEEGNKK